GPVVNRRGHAFPSGSGSADFWYSLARRLLNWLQIVEGRMHFRSLLMLILLSLLGCNPSQLPNGGGSGGAGGGRGGWGGGGGGRWRRSDGLQPHRRDAAVLWQRNHDLPRRLGVRDLGPLPVPDWHDAELLRSGRVHVVRCRRGRHQQLRFGRIQHVRRWLAGCAPDAAAMDSRWRQR